MRRIDLGVFEPVDAIGDLVSFAALLGPVLDRPGGAERAAGVIKKWADDDTALLVAAEASARYGHHEDAADILRRARELATA